MRISIVVVTVSEQIRDYVGDRREGIIPLSSRSISYYAEQGANFSVFGFMPQRDGSYNGFEDFLLSLPESNGILIVCEQSLIGMVAHLSVAVFVHKYELRAGSINAQNILAKPLAKILKDFSIFSRLFDNLKTRKILLLPIRNFRAPEMGGLADLFSAYANRDGFGEGLQVIMASLRNRQTPKQPKTSPKVYLRDDDDKFFEYGMERHALPDTAMPPHSKLCIFTQNLRFGRFYDRELHYNVSRQPDGTDIEGAFLDCHGAQQDVRRTSHINMFANDFMTWPER